MNQKKWSRPAKLRLVKLVVCLAALAVVFTAGALFGRGGTKEPVITNALLSQQLTAIHELATVEYHYTNMGKFENQVDFYGWKVPLTQKSFIIAYDGVIKAGVDAAKITTQVTGKTITVRVPAAKILSHEIDDDSIEIFDETKNIFNQLQISDYTGFAADQRSKIEQRARENGLLAEASEKAKTAVEQLLRLAPGLEEYEIVVQTMNAEEGG